MMNYEIYQTNNRSIMFESYKNARPIKREDYNLVYSGQIDGSIPDALDTLFYVFNMERPEDFKGRSLSVSDVIILDGFAWYVDQFGFKPLDIFETA